MNILYLAMHFVSCNKHPN